MARARNIKPGFFTNDKLAEINPLGRVLFAGLWTIADRAGRLEDRPKKIKAEVLPFDNCSLEKLLADLAARGFVERYEVAGIRYIQITNWGKHQNPHVKEAESTIPPPPKAPGKHGASTVQEPDEAQPKPERAGLIPDSGFLIPDSGGGEETFPPFFEDGFSEEPEAESDAPAPPPLPGSDPELTLDIQFWRAFYAKQPDATWGKGSAAERAREGVIRIIGELGSVEDAVEAFTHACGGCDCDKTAHRRIPTGSIAMLMQLVIDQIDEASRALSKGKAKGKIFKRSDYVPGKVG